ncbi:MAG: hypothetical protein QN152_08925 [Armatimonadota bacterium]|nr:hypothetical protein [Armatimonadota bacterium]MDR7426486.1 hypothetical protein [Armatimonadota bacterium]MDR7463383.1 hypothetical protein [Armatimonadota bacterium]MDR7468562.1 hypothetical protein [Armatimonadota bacterium]MDR7475155.1 hypothetical protein [Armatimonadota bacterium]
MKSVPVLVVLVLLVLLPLPAPGAPAVAFTRTASAGGVEVRVTYAPPEYFALVQDSAGARRFAPEQQIVFLISLDTHGGDLRSFDLVRNSRLRTRTAGGAVREYAPARWEAINDGSHHRSGALIFPAVANGTRVIAPEVDSITLVIAGLAGVPVRTFEWTLPVR